MEQQTLIEQLIHYGNLLNDAARYRRDHAQLETFLRGVERGDWREPVESLSGCFCTLLERQAVREP